MPYVPRVVRTGALHVGDRLLAINGVSLRGKTLTDAVHLLQNAGDTVTVKIMRPAISRTHAGQRRIPVSPMLCVVNEN